MRSWLGTLIVIVMIFWIVTQPKGAAASLDSILDTLQHWATNVTVFFSKATT